MSFGTLPATVVPPVGVENGGTGSTTSLGGGKVMVSVADTIQESAVTTASLIAAAASAPQAFTVNKWVYISEYGSDVTGDGTYNKPWATSTHAMGLIVDAATNNRYAIHVRGTISEATVYLKPYVWYYGDNWGSSRLNATGTNAVQLYPAAFAAGNSRTGITNVYMTGSTGITLDFVAQTASGSHVVEIDNIGVNGAVVINSNNNNQYFQWRGALTFSDFTVHGCSGLITNSFIAGNFLVDNGTAALSGTGLNIISSLIGGNLTVSGDGVHANPLQITSSTVGGNTVLSGVGTDFYTDAISVGLKGTITIGAGTNFTRTNDAFSLGYTPTTAGDWSVQPTSVQQALDLLAAKALP